MSDAEKTSLKKEMEEVKPDVDQGNHNEPSPSAPSEKAVTTDAQDENQRKFLEAMFKIQRGNIAMDMWNIFNSK